MTSIRFPVLFVYSGCDELLPLASLPALQQFLQQPQALLFGADCFIDSAGLQWTFDTQYTFRQTGPVWTLTELTLRVQRHFFAQQQCCVSKINAPDISALIALVQQDAVNTAD
ncbi:DUF4144 family protein [Rheinheimera texasensis]|uniref:DUF4144 family protein n=1 Tax=Rheinheimera texasensis TaxID=306205 RepID=UPI0032B1CD75